MGWDFQVGQKVVCTRHPKPAFKNAAWLKHIAMAEPGVVYTIRKVFPGDVFTNGTGEIFVYLTEIINPKVWTHIGPFEPGFCRTLFRPLVERKTDISIFTRMLNPNEQKVNV